MAGDLSWDVSMGLMPQMRFVIDQTVNVTASALALGFVAAEGLRWSEIAVRPILQDEVGHLRWPGGVRHFHLLPPRGLRPPLVTAVGFRRFYAEHLNGLITRDYCDNGRFGVSLRGRKLILEVGLGGGAAVFRAVGRHCEVHLADPIPATALCSIGGMLLREVVGHELFAGSTARITSAVTTRTGTTRLRIFDSGVPLVVMRRIRI